MLRPESLQHMMVSRALLTGSQLRTAIDFAQKVLDMSQFIYLLKKSGFESGITIYETPAHRLPFVSLPRLLTQITSPTEFHCCKLCALSR